MSRIQRRRILVTTTAGRTIMGEMALSWPWSVRVRKAKIIDRGDDPSKAIAADGVVIVPRSSIEYLQII